MADEAGRTGRPPTSDGDDLTCGRYALGEFTITPRSALEDERPPGLLGERYEVGRLIGSGGTARVYRSYDVRLGREVAVKIYDRDAVALDQRRRLREMTIQGSISHPGVVALLDSGTEHGRTYLVMQLVEGENLAERLLSGPMPAADVTAMADGLAEALAHVHARRIVHRDLKPANVFLSADGPLIGDFGIAHALDATHITGTGLIPGTAAYLAPEQVSGEPAGPPADVYALGLILLECLTGQREYLGTMVEAAMARLTRPPRIPEDAPPALAYTLRRMTQREPADRPSAAKVLNMLHSPPPTLPWSRTQRSPRWRRRSAAAAGAAPAAGAAHPDTAAAFSPARGELNSAEANAARSAATAAAAGPIRSDRAAAEAIAAHGATAAGPHPAPGVQAAAEATHAPATAGPHPARGAAPTATHPGSHPTRANAPSPTRRDPLADAPTHHHDLAAVASAPAENPRRRRVAAAAGLTAAAVAAVAAVLLTQQEAGTGSPAQPPPAAQSPTAASTPASATPLAESGTSVAPRPGPGPGGSGTQPGTSEAASLEPAAVTHETPPSAGPPSKQGKPPKTDPPGKTRGKGPGHDS
ncbi:serine/threonine-protein kinase [Amycolatopsis sp. CA-128772]|uniref:serine/threonine-protein kinase n=1 Tax=Amycolatopsis sp. CA-128772 TaxID=2073159 RepID=UPI001E5CB503|nr:serine/threonine-protein kinase [Amycolatopsis sp. CA-128772]